MRRSSTKVSSSIKQQSSSENEATENSSSSISDNDENDQQPTDLAHTVRKQKKCFELLKSFRNYYVSIKEPNAIINSAESLNYMHQIFTNIKFLINESKEQINSLDVFCDPELVRIFVNLFEYCLIGLGLATGKKGNLYNDVLKLHHYLNSLSQLVWCLTNFSAKFRTYFDARNGTRALLEFLRDQNVVDNFVLYKRSDLLKLDKNYSFMKALIGSLHNLSKTVSTSFQGLNATHTLISFVHQIKSENQTYLMPVYMTLANILTDKEIDDLPDTVEIVERLVKKIKMCADMIAEKKSSAPRVTIDLENGRKVNVCAICDSNGIQWDLTELIWGLYRIAANDKIKNYIYLSCNIKEITNRLITFGNLIEKEFSILLLYQLSFDTSVAKAIMNDKALIKAIKELGKMYEGRQDCRELTKHCENLLWSLYSKTADGTKRRVLSTSDDGAKGSTSGSSGSKKKQIMISYNTQSRELCLKIKSFLEGLGYSIWIDIENIHGSSLEAMATAIENSDCILICMTEKYKLSPNCRAEAEYAFNIRKKYIPLRMQANYQPDGWLGMILGSRIFVDFTKYAFEDAVNRLKKQLNQLLNEHQNSKETTIKENPEPVTNNNAQLVSVNQSENKLTNGGPAEMPTNKWDNEKVRKWLDETGVDRSILSDLTNFDGEMLEELNWIREKASEYFFKSISKNSQIELSQVTRFSKQLRKLFN